MKIKVGQWVRTTEGVIYKSNNNLVDNTPNKFIKSANTPQELVQVGDLVTSTFDNSYRFKRNVFEIHKVESGTFDGKKWIDILDEYGNTLNEFGNKVTAIYTPNKDKTQYTLQWKKEEHI